MDKNKIKATIWGLLLTGIYVLLFFLCITTVDKIIKQRENSLISGIYPDLIESSNTFKTGFNNDFANAKVVVAGSYLERVTSFELEDQDLRDRIDAFMARFKVGTLLNRAGIKKLRGVSPLLVLRIIFELAFVGRNIFTGIHKNFTAPVGKDAVYRFISAPRHNWRRLIGFLSQVVIKVFLEPLTKRGKEKVLILDTTIYDRSRSSKVELLSKVYDHCAKI